MGSDLAAACRKSLQRLSPAGCRRALVARLAAMCAAYTSPLAVGAVQELAQGQPWGAYSQALWGVMICLAGSALVCWQHWPEAWFPGTPALHVLNSHFLMHTLVLAEYVLEWRLVQGLAVS